MAGKTSSRSIRAAAKEAVDSVQPTAEAALDRLGSATESVLISVADTVAPVLDEAKERLSPAVEEARAALVPLASQAVVESKARGRRAAVKLGLAEEARPSHRLRNLLVLAGLGGLAAVVYRKTTGKDADPAWTAGRDSAAASTASESALADPGSAESSTTTSSQPSPLAAAGAVGTQPGQSDLTDTTDLGPGLRDDGDFGSDLGAPDSDSAAVTTATAGPVDESETAPTAPLASEETVESTIPTTPDDPLEKRDL